MFEAVRVNSNRPIRWPVILGLLLVPLLIVAGFLGATWNSTERLHQVQAAVVNLDEPVKIDGQIVPLGRQLTANLVDGEKHENFTWVLADEAEARAGLASGRYAAIVVVPENFSEAATSYAKNDADEAHRATLKVETSPVAGVADTMIGQVLANAATKTLNETLTKAYLDQVYVGFNEMGEQFQTVADAADKIADGNQSMATGIGQARYGVEELSAGLTKLSNGSEPLRDGATKLGTGVSQLSNGLTTMKNQTRTLPRDTAKLAKGTSQLASGLNKLDKGTGTYSDGLSQYVGGVNQVIGQVKSMTGMLPALRDGLTQLSKGADSVSDGATKLKTGIDQSADGAKSASDNATKLANGLNAYQDGLTAAASSSQTCLAAGYTPGTSECTAFLKGIGFANAQLTDTGIPSGLTQLAAGLKPLSNGLAQLSKGADSLSDGAAKLSKALTAMADKIPMPNANDTKQLDKLAAAGPKLVRGFDQIADGINKSASGASQLASGTKKLADGMGKLADGIAKAADGASKLNAGVGLFVEGVKQYTGGVDKAAAGTSQLATGLIKAHDGAQKLADGSRKLADGLADGVEKLPTYDKHQREQLSTVVASPVSTADLDSVVKPNLGWAALLLVLALWLGALATYAVVQAVSPRVALSSSSTMSLVGKSLLPGLTIVGLQGVALSVVAQLVLGLPMAKTLAIVGILLVAAVAFVAINHALAAWLGGVGRLIAIAFAVLSAAAALTYAAPGVFDSLRAFSPLTPALDGIRAILTDSPGATQQVFTLLGWALAGSVASAAAVVRKRTVAATELMTA